MKKPVELWKTFPGSAGIEISSFGNVRSLDGVKCSEGYEHYISGNHYTNSRISSGYRGVCIPIDGKYVTKKVHRLVAQTFIPNPNNMPQVNHKDGDKSNNNVSNLEWCTNSYNDKYKKVFGKSLERPVYAINLSTLEVSWFPSQIEAGRSLGVNVGHVNSVVKGKMKKLSGYWFVEDNGDNFNLDKDRLREIRVRAQFRYGVYAINLDTQEAFHFKSQQEAGQSLGVDSSSINSVLKGRLKQAGGYYFVEDTGGDFKLDKDKLREIKDEMRFKGGVYAIDLETLEAFYFKTQRVAGQELGIDNSNINKVLKGKQKTAKGYWFISDNEKIVEIVREKFGDTVANEIATLIAKRQAI